MPGNDTYTKLLIHSDTTDGSTAFVDSSGSEHTITANGNVHHETDQAKFGATGIHCDGTGDFLSVANHADFLPGSTVFTFDAWLNLQRIGGDTQRICGVWNSGGETTAPWAIRFTGGGWMGFSAYNGTDVVTAWFLAAETVTGSWIHLEACWDGSNLRIFRNGQLQESPAFTGTIVSSTSDFTIGRLGNYNAEYFQGYVDEPRFSRGIVRHTGNFTPPTGPYSADEPVVSDRFIPPFPGFPSPHNNGFLPGLSPSGLIRQNRKGFSKAF